MDSHLGTGPQLPVSTAPILNTEGRPISRRPASPASALPGPFGSRPRESVAGSPRSREIRRR